MGIWDCQDETQKVQWWLPGAGGEGNGSYCLMGTEFQFHKRKTYGDDGADGYTAV